MTDYLGRAVEQWRRIGVPLLAAAAPAEVGAVWRRLSRPLSADVLGLYTAVGGFAHGATDDRHWSLWPLDRVVEENLARPGAGVRFSDVLIDSHFYEFRLAGPDRASVWLVDGGAGFEVAAGVGEFLARYLDDPVRIFLVPATANSGEYPPNHSGARDTGRGIG